VYKVPRGTKDILPDEQRYWRHLEKEASDLARLYGFLRLDTPVFEDSSLFHRTVGEHTDLIRKETYDFQDRGNDMLTLRPEGTAPICRAYIEHGMQNMPQPVRLFYFCPVFRYDRPQAGRFRQHHQFGIEVIGESDAIVDAEVIHLGWTLLSKLGLKNLKLAINSIGDYEERKAYVSALRDYYGKHVDSLCRDCSYRLEKNPLRLLDCKKEVCQSFQNGAPPSISYLGEESRSHWEELIGYLKALDVDYIIDHRLVRGLDYYTRTVFEIQPSVEGSQSTLLGGGRYDRLIEQLGGKPTPGVGFASGMERLILNMQRDDVLVSGAFGPTYLIATINDAGAKEAMKLASQLRGTGVGVLIGAKGRSLRSQMRNAHSLKIPSVIILGEDEISKGTVVVRNMVSGEQEEIPVEKFLREKTG
jgi:histidyl-tRNA synthetase